MCLMGRGILGIYYARNAIECLIYMKGGWVNFRKICCVLDASGYMTYLYIIGIRKNLSYIYVYDSLGYDLLLGEICR